MVTTTDELVERFNKWAQEMEQALRPKHDNTDDQRRTLYARIDTLGWAINNLKRIRDEIDAEYDSKP